MKLYIPLRNWIFSQPFSANYNSYYKEGGLKGHSGIDITGMGNDHTIYASTDSEVFSIINRDNPDPMRYRCVYTLIEDNGIFYELSYGHLFDIYVNIGDKLKKGNKIGVEGNTGDVASGGRKITKEEKLAGSLAGRHLHFQLRLVKPVDKRGTGKYLQNEFGYFKKNGQYFEVQDYNNGFAGCIDPKPYMVEQSAYTTSILDYFKPTFKRNLRYGVRGDDVKTIQKKLGILADGIFGVQTDGAVRNFQKINGLTVDGIVGIQTWNKMI